MKESDNVLRILKEAKIAIQKEDTVKLKELSNQTIHTSSVSQDPDNVTVAVIVYSLSKIIERKKYREYPGWKEFYKSILAFINNSINAIEKKDDKKIKESLGEVRRAIGKVSGKLKDYIKDVFMKAKINKASKIYEHGISMEKTARLLGITLFDLAEYAGQKPELTDAPLIKTLGVKERIKIAEEIFG